MSVFVKKSLNFSKIVEKNIENGITKIIKADYIRDGDTKVTKLFATTNKFGAEENTKTDNYWDYYLNHTWYESISNNPINYKEMIERGIWYLGIYAASEAYGYSGSYKDTICKNKNTTETTKICERTNEKYEGVVGLGRIGEPFTSQIKIGTNNSSDMWTITPFTSNVHFVTYANEVNDYPSTSRAVKPSMFLSSDVIITDGLGTEQSPFEINLPIA